MGAEFYFSANTLQYCIWYFTDGKFRDGSLIFKNQLYVAIFSILLTILVLPYGAGMTSAIILVASEIMITAYQYYCLKSKGYQLFNLDMLTKKHF